MTLKTILKKIKSVESTASLLLGIGVVVIVGVMLFNYFKSYSGSSPESIAPESASESKEGQETGKGSSLPTRYTVTVGDSLWKISEKFYQSGYNWANISQENKLDNPDRILVGQELVIPNVPAEQPLASKSVDTEEKTTGNQIAGSKYTVVKGDNLWNISVRAYQDGFRWSEIAKANNLANPNLIHPGNVLVIPR